MSRFAAGRMVLTFACVVAVPLLTFAQQSSHPAVIAAPPAAAPSSSSAVNEAWLNLPNAPLPQAQQQTNTGQTQNPKPNQQQSTPPSQNNGLTLQGLGFKPSQTQANAKLQARLNKRTHMLKVHQTLGLITTIPMAATLITGPQAKAKGKNGQTITEPTAANLDFHIALGGLATGMYWTTAYYAIFAPKIPNVKPRGAIRLHRDLEWVHGPGMIITPLLGIAAYKQENAGEKVHGIASWHGTAAYITTIAYGASIVAVSWPIHLKFWEHSK